MPLKSHANLGNPLPLPQGRHNYQQEYNVAVAQLAAELSAGATQQFQYMEYEQRLHAQTCIRTVEAALGNEYQQAQANLQRQYFQ